MKNLIDRKPLKNILFITNIKNKLQILNNLSLNETKYILKKSTLRPKTINYILDHRKIFKVLLFFFFDPLLIQYKKPIYIIREFNEKDDSINNITKLLHRAYSIHKKKKLNYLASYQNNDVTYSRLKSGKSFVAVIKPNKIIGTITVYDNSTSILHRHYGKKNTYHFGQFAVDPEYQGLSIGKNLYLTIEKYCKENKAYSIMTDTSVKAKKLIRMYNKWGYRIIDKEHWENTNYYSFIFEKKI